IEALTGLRGQRAEARLVEAELDGIEVAALAGLLAAVGDAVLAHAAVAVVLARTLGAGGAGAGLAPLTVVALAAAQALHALTGGAALQALGAGAARVTLGRRRAAVVLTGEAVLALIVG